MWRLKTGWPPVLVAILLVAASRLDLRAQDPREPKPERGAHRAGYASVQDALLAPYHFTFRKPTPLEDVTREISRTINAPVAIDRAAIDRLGLKIDDPVQLELEGVRLKTGLKLLLDQLDLTYRVVPEDNLLIITDATGSVDPIDQVLSEIKALHNDLHDVQDSVDEIRAALGLDGEGGAKVRKPTIIEEMPAHGAEDKGKSKEPPPQNTPPRSRPGF